MLRVENLRRRFQLKDRLAINLLSEFFGSVLLVFIGLMIVMQFDLSHRTLNTWIQVNLGWGFAIIFCVYTTSKTSVSLMLYSYGALSFMHLVLYCIVQTLGCFIGAGLAYLVYYDQFWHVCGADRIPYGPNETFTIFASMPAPHISNLIAFIDHFIATGLLGLFATVVIDKRNKIPSEIHPILFGLIVTMIGTAVGMNVGYPLNPARDLGPRIFAWMVGYGTEVFTYRSYYFWIPIVAPCLGTVFAGWSYQFFVGFHISDSEELDRKTQVVYTDRFENVPLKKPQEA